MADDDTQTTAAPTDPGLIDKYLALLNQPPPNIQPDQTPVDTSGFWGGYRHVVGILGEALGGGKNSPGYDALSPTQKEAAGAKALGDFGTQLMAASRYQPGQTIFSNLAQGFQGAERSYRGAEQDAAGLLAGRQAYATEQQANQLARIKEALPLLTLKQKMDAIKALPPTLGGGTPGAGGGGSNVAEGGSVSVPPEYLPFYQEASARTGIPVEVLIAQHRQESGFNPGATGAAGEIGIGQISPKTAADPGYGMTGLKNPDVLRDPRTNINFAADYLAAKAKAVGADFSSPEGIAKALKAYNGGGDPDYVNHVLRYVPGAKTTAAAPPRAPAAPPGAPTPGTATARPTLPAPEAPIAPSAGAQVAGPGAPTTGGPAPTMPGTAADVADIRAGMVGAGADPTTLAPGPGSAPAPGGVVVAAGPAGPTAPAPGSYEEYRLLHPITPSAEDIAGFRTTPDPAQLANLQKQAANAQTSYAAARANLDTAGMAKASDDYNTAIAKENELRQAAAKLGTDTRAKFMETQDAARRAAWAKDVEDQRKQADAATAAKNKLDEIAATGEQSRLSNVQASTNARNEKMLTQLDGEASAARGAISDLDGLKALSDNVKNPSVWATIPWGDTTALNRLAQAGLVDKGEAGATQMLQTGISGVIKSLRQGMSMGSLSDRDLTFIQSMGPNLYQDQDTRSAVIAYLKQAQQAKIRFNVEVNKEMTRPGTNMADAIDRAQQKLPDIVPPIPAELWSHWKDPDPAWADKRKEWAQDNNVSRGTLVRKPNGGLELLK